MMCVSESIPVPENFLQQSFLSHALNWSFASKLERISNQTLRDAVAGRFTYHESDSRRVNPATRFVIPYDGMFGQAWLIDNLVVMFSANIRTSNQAKWRAVVNDSIQSFKQIHDLDAKSDLLKEIKRLIFNPSSSPSTIPLHPLTEETWALVDFHRHGFHLHDTEASLDDAYFRNEELYHHHVFHFGKCLERQCELEQMHGLDLKKRLPLPMCAMGQRNSIQIDKKGLYWILCELKKRCGASGRYRGHLPFQLFQTLEKQQAMFTSISYKQWIHRLFHINDLLSRGKFFLDKGVGLTTDGVQVSIHYSKIVSVHPDAKKKPIKSAVARVNARR